MKRITQIIFTSLTLLTTQLSSQQLVTDLTPFAIGSSPDFVKSSANYLVFTANSKEFGTALFVTDSAEGSTRLIKSLPTSSSSYKFIDVQVFDTTCYFVYGYGVSFELWTSSLNMPNPIRLRSGDYAPTLFAELGNYIYFPSWTSGNGLELWRTNGTVAGTTALFKMPFSPQKMVVANSLLFFLTDDQVWKSDATLTGTTVVKKMDVLYSTRPFVGSKNLLYFSMTDSLSGTELWKSDGTIQGTQMVKDIYQGKRESSPFGLTVAGNNLYFFARDSINTGLFRTDGTAQGTQLVKHLRVDFTADKSYIIARNNDVYFRAFDTNYDYSFWKSDGTEQGTIKLKGGFIKRTNDNNVNEVGVSTDNGVIFNAMDNVRGEELWKTDGTPAGTVLVKDIFPGISSSSINNLKAFKNKAYFSANDSLNGAELWRTDGTANGTKIFTKLNPTGASSSPNNVTIFNNQLYFFATTSFYGNELMKSDGTKNGTSLVKDILPGVRGYGVKILRTYGNKLFLKASSDYFGFGDIVSISDGTEAGTKELLSANSNRLTDVKHTTVFKNKLFLNVSDFTTRNELWTSDGTNEGTKLFKDINPTGSSDPTLFDKNTTLGDSILLFTANDGVNGFELWKTNGTTQGTVMVADIYPNDPRFFPPEHIEQILVIGNSVYFSAVNGVVGSELWKSDGTPTGTVLVKDINLGTNSSRISSTTNFKNTLFFSATNGVNGSELWKSDGTANGTTIVKDIVPGSDGSEPDGLTVHKNELFFVCEKDSTNTDALWKTDGTTNGTVRIKRPFPNGLSGIKNMLSTDTYLYFSATNGVNGTELWRTNGTDTGTVMVFDLNAGAASSSPDNFTFYKNDLFFVADNETTGRELWRLTASPNVSVKESATIDIVLFPNPTSEYLNVQQEETDKAYSVNLFNNSGKLMIGNILLTTGNTQIDVHNMPSGLYFLEIKEKNSIKSILKKVIITR